jgi:Polyketide cyclase / dehydrase and lipid transport
MRWFLGLALVVALILGVLFGVGFFLLDNTLSVTRTIQIDRPRAAVFAMANDLRIAKEWSPFYAMDPDAEYSFSNEPGQGQSMHWTSAARDVGAGRMSIVDSVENSSVDGILELRKRAKFNTRLEFARQEGQTSTVWTMSAQCAAGAINVPCRYMNLILRSRIERQLDDGLRRLKTLAEQLPDVDFEGIVIQEIPIAPQDVLFVDITLTMEKPTFADRDNAERNAIAHLSTAGVSGDLVRVFPMQSRAGGGAFFSVGYAYSGPAPLTLVGMRAGRTPGGAALRAQFVGRRSQIGAMYQKIDAYRQAHRIQLRPDAEAWEVVQRVEPATEAFPNDPVEHTEIYYPVQ